jgi:hypothetical protein
LAKKAFLCITFNGNISLPILTFSGIIRSLATYLLLLTMAAQDFPLLSGSVIFTQWTAPLFRPLQLDPSALAVVGAGLLQLIKFVDNKIPPPRRKVENKVISVRFFILSIIRKTFSCNLYNSSVAL